MAGSVGFPSAQENASIQLWTLPGVTFGKKTASSPPGIGASVFMSNWSSRLRGVGARGRCQSFHDRRPTPAAAVSAVTSASHH
jgi:hypothetical protein